MHVPKGQTEAQMIGEAARGGVKKAEDVAREVGISKRQALASEALITSLARPGVGRLMAPRRRKDLRLLGPGN